MDTPENDDEVNRPEQANGLGLRIPPYTLTGGRTVSNVHLEVETMVVARPMGISSSFELQPEHHQIIELCATAQSVAEISALLGLHLGVARVLTGDLIENGYLDINHETVNERPDLRLLERVLDGLQTL